MSLRFRRNNGLNAMDDGSLASVDKKLRVFHGRLLQDAVAQIYDVSAAEEFGDQAEGCVANLFGRGEENGWVEVTLDGDAGTSEGAEFVEWDAPVDTENVGADFDDGREKVVRGFGVIDDWDGVA